MNTYGIDERVWAEVIGEQPVTPALVALAACVCPEVLDEKIVWTPFKSLLMTEISDIARECCTGATEFMRIRNALVEWVMLQKNAQVALNGFLEWDRRLAVWCACAVAETALHHISESEHRPRLAIAMARSWVLGRVTNAQLRLTVDAAVDADEDAMGNDEVTHAHALACAAVASAVGIAGCETFDNSASFAASAVASTADVTNDPNPEWTSAENAELERLCEVVAQAIIDYPTAEMNPLSEPIVEVREGSRKPSRVK